jgi:ferredoxin
MQMPELQWLSPPGKPFPLTPSAGPPGEGGGESLLSSSTEDPHLTPLPEHRASEQTRDLAAVETLADLITRIENDEIVFPLRSAPRLLEQLRSCNQRKPNRLICSLLDGDTDLPLQGVLGLREPASIVRAVAMLRTLTGIRRAWLIADAGLPDEWTRQLSKLAAEARLRCIFIRNDYPQSDPTLLLYTLLGRRLRPGMLPTEQGVLILDGAAAWRLDHPEGAAVTPIAVRDLIGNNSQYAIAPIGWRLEQVLQAMKISCVDRLIRVSDPLRDLRAQPDWRIDGSEITVHLMRPERPINPDPCVRCGWCAEGCPVRIQPAGILEAAQRSSPELAERFGLHACIECGICSYVCPSRLPLLDAIRSLREK